MSDFQSQPPAGWSGEPPRQNRTGVIVAVAALIVLLVGGGVALVLLLGSDETSNASSPTETTTSQSTEDPSTGNPTTSEPTTTEPTTQPRTQTSTTTEPTGPHITPGQSFCERFEKNATSNEFDDVDPADIDKLVAELEVFRQLAPAQLRDDYRVLISAVEGDLAPDMQTSIEAIQTYAVDNCDVTLDGS